MELFFLRFLRLPSKFFGRDQSSLKISLSGLFCGRDVILPALAKQQCSTPGFMMGLNYKYTDTLDKVLRERKEERQKGINCNSEGEAPFLFGIFQNNFSHTLGLILFFKKVKQIQKTLGFFSGLLKTFNIQVYIIGLQKGEKVSLAFSYDLHMKHMFVEGLTLYHLRLVWQRTLSRKFLIQLLTLV